MGKLRKLGYLPNVTVASVEGNNPGLLCCWLEVLDLPAKPFVWEQAFPNEKPDPKPIEVNR